MSRPATDSPDALVEKQMAFEKLVILINQLPERERDLIALKFGAGLTNREIAQLTNLSETNVGSNPPQKRVKNCENKWE